MHSPVRLSRLSLTYDFCQFNGAKTVTDTEKLPTPLRGIVAPMITPLSDRDTLDHAGLARLVEHILAGGVRGLFILGTTGEGPSLSYRLRCELIERVGELVAGRVPVLVGVTDTAFVESVNLSGHAADAGAAAVVLSAPYYFPAGQPELIEYVEHIAREIPLPIFLYNMPSHTKISFEVGALEHLFQLPNVAGLKDSSGNMSYFHEVKRLIEDRPDLSLLIGPEALLAEAVLMGGHGGVTGGANLAPRLFVGLYQAAVRGDLDTALELQAKVMKLASTVYSVGRHASAFLKGVKCALTCLGICDDAMAEPFQRFHRAEREQIERYVRELEIDQVIAPSRSLLPEGT
jgi:4-hydroxy-tetrahydrodipicolinate synthase